LGTAVGLRSLGFSEYPARKPVTKAFQRRLDPADVDHVIANAEDHAPAL
jgi:hypothetical protein